MPHTSSGDFGSGTIRILIIDDNSPFVLPLLRSFSGYKNIHLDVLVISPQKALHFRYSRFLARIDQVEKLDVGNVVSVLKDVVSRFKSDLIIPTREWLSVLLFNHKEELGKFVKLHPLPSSSTIEITGNKWKLNQWLISNDFPSAISSDTLEGWSGGFPVLFKPVFGIGGRGIHLLESKEEMQRFLKNNKPPEKSFILQEYIEGFDIDLSFFAIEGKILYHTIQQGLISEKMVYSKGIEFVKNDDLLKLVKGMISKLNYTGIAHLDFRYSTLNKQYILIDFNSRYWSSVQGSRAMGINFPYLVLAWTLSQEAEALDYRTGTYYFSTVAIKTKIRNLFSGSKYPIKLKDTQLSYIFKDPLPELMFLLGRIGGSRKRKT